MSAFPAGTIFTVSLHPLRSGEPAGAREGALYKCPREERLPAAGKHCDSVEGMVQIGGDDVVPRNTRRHAATRQLS